MSNKNVTFSVITPTFNGEKFIHRAIESVINQTFIDFEYIIVNDGSRDNTAKIVNDWKIKDSRLKIITTKGFGEPVEPTNIAIKATKGKYIAFLDHDDTWEKNKLELLLKYFEENNYDMVISSVYLSDNITKKLSAPEKSDPEYLISGKYFNTFSAIVVKKDLFETIGLVEKQMLVLADYELIIRAISNKKSVFFLDKPLATHYFHKTNLSGPEISQTKRIKDLLFILSKHDKFINKNKKTKAYILGTIARILLRRSQKKKAFVYFLKSFIIYPLDIRNVFRVFLGLLGENNYEKVKNRLLKIKK